MKTLQIQKCAKPFIVGVLAALVLVGCSTSRQQPSADNTSAAASATPAAQPTAQAAKPKPAKHASEEASTGSSSKGILSQIHQADLREIAIAKMANEKAASDEVRQYAAQLIADDTSADRSVAEVAQKLNVHLSDTVATRHQSAQSKLNSATGADFDKQFLQQISAEHGRLIASLKQQQQNTSNDDVEALIEKILPIFQQQQQLAQMLMKKEQA
jgi:putative membrane protein